MERRSETMVQVGPERTRPVTLGFDAQNPYGQAQAASAQLGLTHLLQTGSPDHDGDGLHDHRERLIRPTSVVQRSFRASSCSRTSVTRQLRTGTVAPATRKPSLGKSRAPAGETADRSRRALNIPNVLIEGRLLSMPVRLGAWRRWRWASRSPAPVAQLARRRQASCRQVAASCCSARCGRCGLASCPGLAALPAGDGVRAAARLGAGDPRRRAGVGRALVDRRRRLGHTSGRTCCALRWCRAVRRAPARGRASRAAAELLRLFLRQRVFLGSALAGWSRPPSALLLLASGHPATGAEFGDDVLALLPLMSFGEANNGSVGVDRGRYPSALGQRASTTPAIAAARLRDGSVSSRVPVPCRRRSGTRTPQYATITGNTTAAPTKMIIT